MTRMSGRWLALVLWLLSAALMLLGTGVGSTGLDSLAALQRDPQAWQIVWEIRLPRSVGAWLAGALLGLAGALAQGLFRNPLADPYLLGSASGASLGVALAMALLGVSPLATEWLSLLGLSGAAFAGAALAVLLTLLLAQGVQHTLRLLLAGVVVAVVLGAMTSLVLLLSPDIMQAMQSFMLGRTSFLAWPACGLMAAVALLCMLAAWAMSPVLDALALGESTAQSLGLPLPALYVQAETVLRGGGAGESQDRRGQHPQPRRAAAEGCVSQGDYQPVGGRFGRHPPDRQIRLVGFGNRNIVLIPLIVNLSVGS